MTLFRSDNRSIKYISMAGDLRSCGHQTGVKRTSEDEYSCERVDLHPSLLHLASSSVLSHPEPTRVLIILRYTDGRHSWTVRDAAATQTGALALRPGRRLQRKHPALDHHAPVSGTSVSNGFGAPKRPRSSSSSSSSTCSAVRFSRKLSSPSSKTGRLTSRGARLRVEELRCIKSELKVIKNQIDELLNRLEHMDTQSRGPSGPAHVSEGRLSQSPVNRAEGSSRSPLRDWLGPEAGEASSEERQTKSHKLYYI